jgi:hypothetical protein
MKPSIDISIRRKWKGRLPTIWLHTINWHRCLALIICLWSLRLELRLSDCPDIDLLYIGLGIQDKQTLQEVKNKIVYQNKEV